MEQKDLNFKSFCSFSMQVRILAWDDKKSLLNQDIKSLDMSVLEEGG